MGLFGKLFSDDEKEKNTNTVSLEKSSQELDKVLVNLSKSSKVNLSKHVAKVALAMDYSGSMDWLYQNGSVQNTITRLFVIAKKFDDDGELESWLFSNGKKKLKPVNDGNYEDYVSKVMLKSGMNMGGTNYAPVLEDIVKHYKNSGNVPAFIMFITDGENFDKNETDKIVKELSEYNMFVQFVGIGNEKFSYLRSLDDMEGRKCDNTGFISVKDMNKMNDDELYTELLRQYKDWLNNK